jgi:hypothetical protein
MIQAANAVFELERNALCLYLLEGLQLVKIVGRRRYFVLLLGEHF